MTSMHAYSNGTIYVNSYIQTNYFGDFQRSDQSYNFLHYGRDNDDKSKNRALCPNLEKALFNISFRR